MNETSWHSRGREWLTSHALWELAKYIFIPAFAGLVSLGISRITHATLDTAFNIFLVLIGGIGILCVLGAVRMPAFRKKQEPNWEVFFLISPGLVVSLSPSIGRVVINLHFLSTKATELIYLQVTLRNSKGTNLNCENPEPITVAAMQVNSVMIDRKFSPQELTTFDKGEMVSLDGYGKFRDGNSMKLFRIMMNTIPSV